MRIYLAGVITRDSILPPEEVEKNLALFDRAELLALKEGHSVCNPAHRCRANLGDPEWPRSRFMRVGFMDLVRCNAICLLPGWEVSPGAVVEEDMAQQMGLVHWVPAGGWK